MNIGKESETIEFKKSTSELKEGIKSISSILNKHNKGILYFGVRDDGVVCGQQIGKETIRTISRDIRDRIKPECKFEIINKKTIDGLEFIKVMFNGDRRPYSYDGKYFMRFSDQDRQMTPYELEKLFKIKKKDYSEWEISNSYVDIKEVDEKLIRKVISNGFMNKRIPYEYKNVYDMLNKFGLIFNKNTLNNAGNILFSKNKPVLLKLATFATETKDTFIKLDHFYGNIYECIDKAISYILSTIDWKIIIDGSANRKEEPEIPQKAIREIVINAFCHAEYNSNTSFEIDIFKDRLSIYSPGFFPSGFLPEDFAYKHEEPIMLNPKIISVLFKTCEIESFGYGFDNVFKICKENDINYKYENTKTGFKFIFYRPLGHKYVPEMSKTEKLVFEEIKKNCNIRAKDIAKTINKSEKTVYRSIKKIKEQGFIKRVGSDFDGYWKII